MFPQLYNNVNARQKLCVHSVELFRHFDFVYMETSAVSIKARLTRKNFFRDSVIHELKFAVGISPKILVQEENHDFWQPLFRKISQTLSPFA
jgi:hypothetical protein